MKLIEDLKKVNQLDDNQFTAFLKNINSNELSSFRDMSEFEAFCNSINIKFNDAKTIIRVLNFVFDLVFEKRDTPTALKYFEESFIEPVKGDPDAVRAWSRVKDSIGSLTAFFLIRKKYRLQNLLPALYEFNIICDARPIYDPSKAIVDYLFPMILRVKAGNDDNFICELDEEDLALMETEIAYAKLKMSNLKSKLKPGS